MSNASVTYTDIFAPNYIVTGIRQDDGPDHPAVITGSYQDSDDTPQALLYRGPLYPTDSAGYVYLTPRFDRQKVTSSVFYGPNTPLFDPSIGAGNVRAVGSYKYEQSGARDHGMMYQGGFDGLGVWIALDAPQSPSGAIVANTLAHSTMGDLVVGNCDYVDQPGSGNGFIYNIKTRRYTMLDIGVFATAYGVWQNGGSTSSSYTIAGGYDDGKGINQGYLLDYDASTDTFGTLTPFSYNNQPGIVTHFEGITGVPGGYTMAAQWEQSPERKDAAFAAIVRDPNGAWTAQWVCIDNPNSAGLSTGNSILENNLIGIYKPAAGGIQSYVATVDPARVTLRRAAL
jgi:hypothetical protein